MKSIIGPTFAEGEDFRMSARLTVSVLLESRIELEVNLFYVLYSLCSNKRMDVK